MHYLIKMTIKSPYYITTIMQELTFNRKHYSHSIKRLLPNLHPHSNPESPAKMNTLQIKTTKNRSEKRRLKVDNGISYEKMVDQVMKRHAQEEKIPLMMTKLLVRHHYKNYRIINTDKQSSNIEISPKSHKASPERQNANKKLYKEQRQLKSQIIRSTLQSKSNQKVALQLPLILKYDKLAAFQSPSISSKSILTHKSNLSTVQPSFDQMKRKFMKRYLKSYTEA